MKERNFTLLDFVDMSVMARYLYAPGSLPLTNLLMKSNIQALETLFSFQSLQVAADNNQFRLVGGMGEFEKCPVLHLIIDAVSITLAVGGARSDNDRIYQELLRFLTQIDSKKRMENPALYTMTYQTQSTVKLSVPFERLLADKFIGFLKSKKDLLRPNSSSSAEFSLSNLSFQVKYTSPGTTFTFLPKVLTFEPRAGSDPNENLYYVMTPTDSDAHRKIVEEFEIAMNEVH
jgi:hypothetical protein